MSELTLESLAARVAELERQRRAGAGILRATRDWTSVVGMFENSEFSRLVDAEVQAMRDAEQAALDAEGST